jgi:hypothetical protein
MIGVVWRRCVRALEFAGALGVRADQVNARRVEGRPVTDHQAPGDTAASPIITGGLSQPVAP